MRHSWILDVLNDLRSYAEVNNLPAIAASAVQTLGIAEVEISAANEDGGHSLEGSVASD